MDNLITLCESCHPIVENSDNLQKVLDKIRSKNN